MAFCFFEKQNKSDSPRSCTGGNRYRDAKGTIFCRSDRWEGTIGLKKNRERRRDIPPPRFAHLTPEQARAVPIAKDLHDGPVLKQLLEWDSGIGKSPTTQEMTAAIGNSAAVQWCS